MSYPQDTGQCPQDLNSQQALNQYMYRETLPLAYWVSCSMGAYLDTSWGILALAGIFSSLPEILPALDISWGREASADTSLLQEIHTDPDTSLVYEASAGISSVPVIHTDPGISLV